MNRKQNGVTGGGSAANIAETPRSQSIQSGRSTSGTDYASSKTGKAVESVKDAATQQADEMKRQAKEVSAQAKQKAQEAAHQAKESGRQYAAEKKARIADELGVFSGAIRKASSKLHDEQHDSIASYVDAAAEKLDEVRDSLQSKDVAELIDDAQQFARRRPEIVYGGLFVGGLVAMRFLKASSQDTRRSIHGDTKQFGSRNDHGQSTGVRPIGYRSDGTLNPIDQRSESSQRDTEGGTFE